MASFEVAHQHFLDWCRRKKLTHDSLKRPLSARIWRELLIQSMAKVRPEVADKRRRQPAPVAPAFRVIDIGGPAGVRIDGRQWEKFERWFARHIEAELRARCLEAEVPMLYAARLSDRGGYHEEHMSVVFLTTDPPTPEHSPMAAAITPPSVDTTSATKVSEAPAAVGEVGAPPPTASQRRDPDAERSQERNTYSAPKSSTERDPASESCPASESAAHASMGDLAFTVACLSTLVIVLLMQQGAETTRWIHGFAGRYAALLVFGIGVTAVSRIRVP